MPLSDLITALALADLTTVALGAGIIIDVGIIRARMKLYRTGIRLAFLADRVFRCLRAAGDTSITWSGLTIENTI